MSQQDQKSNHPTPGSSDTTEGSTPSSESTSEPSKPTTTCAREPQDYEAVGEHLKEIVREFVNAINIRQLHVDNPIYTHIDPKFSALPTPPWPQKPENLESYLERLRLIIDEFPEYGMKILNLDAVVQRNGFADVCMNFEVLGIFEGVNKRSVAIFRFRKRFGRWYCFTVEAVDGMEGTEGGFG